MRQDQTELVTSRTLGPGLADESTLAQFRTLRCRAKEEFSQVRDIEAVYFTLEEEPLFLIYLADESFNRKLRRQVYEVGHRLEDEFSNLYFRVECLSQRPQKRVPLQAEEIFDHTKKQR